MEKILKEHGIEVIILTNGVIIAKEDDTLTNVSGWSLKKLYSWLGYN